MKRLLQSISSIVLSACLALTSFPSLALANSNPHTISENDLNIIAQDEYGYDDADGSESAYGDEDGDTSVTASDVNVGYRSSTDSRTTEKTTWKRLGGANRYETMRLIVSGAFKTCSGVILATGQNFPDALAASSLAGAMGCPILLTAPDQLSPETRGQLEALGTTNVIIMGGPAAVSENVETELASMGLACGRIQGVDRYETSVYTMRICRDAHSTSDTVIVATGTNYPDSLSVGPWAYSTASPIILAQPDGLLSDQAVEAIRNDPYVKTVVFLGGDAVVSPRIEDQLGPDYGYMRMGGADRYETSAIIADYECRAGFTWAHPSVTTGLAFPDALAAAPLNGLNKSPLLISDSNTSPAFAALYAHRTDITSAFILGGTAAVATDDPIESYGALREFLHGVDVSGWDEGIDIHDLEADFVIIKATEGLQYSKEGILYNPSYLEWADAALSEGKLLGFYHYANGEDPVEEADEFYESIKDYRGRAIACLDWEAEGNEAFDTGVDVEWCKLFLDRIKERFGGTPFLYTSKNFAKKYDWSEVAFSYPLWGAEYADMEEVHGYQTDPWQSSGMWGVWGAYPKIFQYTSMGTLDHNGGIDYFDFDLFLGTREDWLAHQS